ncbi:MAG: aminopeptidase P family protein [Clostridia bacterium]|nr:aminopeptidase P family protein [Clostridia bacterium]
MDRCERLLKETGHAVLITSDENCYYYSGFTGGDSFLLIADGYRGLFTDGRYTVQAKEEAPDFEVFDHDVINNLKKVVSDRKIEVAGFEEANMTVATMARFTGIFKMIPTGGKINALRKIKDASEIEKIAAAQTLSEAAFNYFLENAKEGMTETEAASLIESYMRKNGARKPSFETIVASGARGAMPHARAENVKIVPGFPVVCDFGCVLDNYCSDMTRTVFFSYADDKCKEIYNIVKKANLASLSVAKEGLTAGEVDKAARDIIEKAGYGKEFCHSLGHGVGLQVHEMPYARSKSDEILECGMTLTIEPGIYVPDFCGVRIEDLVIIEENGVRNLNKITKDIIIL